MALVEIIAIDEREQQEGPISAIESRLNTVFLNAPVRLTRVLITPQSMTERPCSDWQQSPTPLLPHPFTIINKPDCVWMAPEIELLTSD